MSFVPRVPMPDGAMTAPGGPLVATLSEYLDEDLVKVRGDFVMSLNGGKIGTEMKEMIRIYNASMSDCNFCKNVRYSVDGRRVLDEDAVDDVRNFESSNLPDEQKVVLRFAKAFYLTPAEIPESVAADLRKYYSEEEIVELTLTLIRARAGSTSLITLGLEPREMAVTVI